MSTQRAFSELYDPPLRADYRPQTSSPYEVHREDARRMSNKVRVLRRLQQGPATTKDLIEVGGTRAPGRVHELRKDYDIEVADCGGGLFVYTLKGKR